MINHADVLALLEDGPHTEVELAAWLGVSPRVLQPTLQALRRNGDVAHLKDGTWVLVLPTPAIRVQEPAPAPKTPVHHTIAGEEFDVVFSGKDSLSKFRKDNPT